MGIVAGAPVAVVDAIEDAAEPIGARGQQTLQAAAVLGGLDFPCIGGADGADPVGVHQAALDEGQLVVEFQAVQGPPVRRQFQLHQGLGREQPLVGQVVDGEEGGRAPCLAAQQGRHQSRLPVVAVHQFRRPAEADPVQGQGTDGACEQGKAPGIVGPVAPFRCAVGATIAVKELGAVHQVEGHGAAGQAALQDADLPGCTLQPQAGQDLDLAGALRHAAVGGQYHADIMAQVADGPWQAAGDIGEAAGLDQRVDLTAGEENLHGGFPGKGGARGVFITHLP